MTAVNITELRHRLPIYLQRVAQGETFRVTVRGRVIALLSPDQTEADAAYQRLVNYRTTARVGDVMTPIATVWSGDSDHLSFSRLRPKSQPTRRILHSLTVIPLTD